MNRVSDIGVHGHTVGHFYGRLVHSMMLSQAERYRLLRFLRFFCTVGFLPIEVDVNSWEIHPCIQPPWKRLLCRISFASYCFHGVYQILSLLYVFMFLRGTPMYQVVIHMVIAAVTTVLSFAYCLLYIKYPAVNAVVFRMTTTGSIVGRKRIPLLIPNSSQVYIST